MITLLDGPLGTELDRRGVPVDETCWSAAAIDDAPETIAAIHRDYAAAGATVHTANTFRTKRRSVGDDWRRLTVSAVALARRNVPPGARVAGSIAPLADCYRPDLSPANAARPEHREFAEALAEAGVDLLLCEAFANIDEALVAVEASVQTGVETWLAMTAGPQGDLLTPAELQRGAMRAADSGAAAILVNCTPARQTTTLIRALRDADLPVPIGGYANAGTAGWQSLRDRHIQSYVAEARRWIAAGATILGGCCGTTPAHLAALTAMVRG